ncbi:oxidized low-density lipoprotein receptor 1-like isoform X2 [Aquarana catesbeiana]|uniref:oxidized low-density lipoprotein receptor 1-like isoform X2 n=1 Tax=Aquarana catesbeiana TaxID=8400 RepID=UPI003CC9350C
MNTQDNNIRNLWRRSWKGVIITLLVGSNIILIRIIEAMVYKGQSLENEVSQMKKLLINSTQSSTISKDHSHVLKKMERIKQQLCVHSDSAGWLWHRADCYYFSSGEQRTWRKSQEWCAMMGAHLLVLQDKKAPEFIQRLLGQQTDDKFWTGMYKAGDEWKWVNGQPSASSLFQPPKESSGNCVLLQQSGEYYAEDCTTQHRWICQKKAVKIDFNVTYY